MSAIARSEMVETESTLKNPIVYLNTIYTPLDSASHEIRVLDILPGQPGSPVTCSVRHTRLLHADTIPYTALSYVWGDPKLTTDLTFNDVKVPVTVNLASALDHVRSQHKTVTFWADALCINQKDDVEKSAQVAMMGDVYREGTGTQIWLGEERDGSDLAMDLIAQMDGEDLESEKNRFDEEGLRAISNLQARDWWSRVWVIQEALLSKSSIIQCGNKCLPISAFIRLDDIRRGWHRSTACYLSTSGSLIPGNPFSSILTAFPDEVLKLKTGRQSDLLDWITSTEDFHATNPRDKIYALLSLSPPSQTAYIVPDYRAPVADVYSAVTTRCIIRWKDLTILHFDTDEKSQEHQLPSWVRDYSSSGLLGKKPVYVPFPPSEYVACGRDCWGRKKIYLAGQFSENLKLRSRGFLIDTVVYVGRSERLPPYTGIDPLKRLANVKERSAGILANVRVWEEKFNAIEKIPYDYSAEGRRKVFWRTLMANRWYTQWAPLPEDMVENVHFETWMGRRPLPESVMETDSSNADTEEVKRLYCKPFTDACVTRCHGRSFVITEQGYIGMAPLKSKIGDIVTVLEGGYVPFILRELEGGGYQFIGESYVHGIMEGEALQDKREDDIQIFGLE